MAYNGFFGSTPDTIMLWNFQGSGFGEISANEVSYTIAGFDTELSGITLKGTDYGQSGIQELYPEDLCVSQWNKQGGLAITTPGSAMYGTKDYLRLWAVYYADDDNTWHQYCPVISFSDNFPTNSQGLSYILHHSNGIGMQARMFGGASNNTDNRLGANTVQDNSNWDRWMFIVAIYPVNGQVEDVAFLVGRIGLDSTLSAKHHEFSAGWTGFDRTVADYDISISTNANYGSYWMKNRIAGIRVDEVSTTGTMAEYNAAYSSFLEGNGVDWPDPQLQMKPDGKFKAKNEFREWNYG